MQNTLFCTQDAEARELPIRDAATRETRKFSSVCYNKVAKVQRYSKTNVDRFSKLVKMIKVLTEVWINSTWLYYYEVIPITEE